MIGCDHVFRFEPDLVQACAKCEVFKFVVDEKALKERVATLEAALRNARPFVYTDTDLRGISEALLQIYAADPKHPIHLSAKWTLAAQKALAAIDAALNETVPA